MCTALIGVAILIGGASRRMGTPKHTCTLPTGITMGATMASLADTIADTVVIAGSTTTTHIGPMANIQCVSDMAHHIGQGPLAGIEAVLASGLARTWIVLPCDMPYLTVDLLCALRDHSSLGAVVLEGAGPLPLRINTTHLGEVTKALNEGRRAIRHLPCLRHAAQVPVADATLIQDVDCPEDLR
jgi:molybdopterin-guanine dinucleotide biosynthesis protein A